MNKEFSLGKMIADAEPSDSALPPPPFNVKLSALSPSYAAVIDRAAHDGLLDMIFWRGERYAILSDLDELCGPGADTRDPAGGCYVSASALLRRPSPLHQR